MNDINFAMGALDSKVDLRDYSYEPEIALAAELPDEFSLWTPPIKNQGSVGSCVAHTAAEIEEYFNHVEGKKHVDLSVGYIYGCRYAYKGQGMYLRDALKTLCNKGTVEHQEFPYNKEVPDMIILFEEQNQIGWVTDWFNRITSYFRIYGEGEDLKDKVKRCLMNNGPVMMSVPWYSDFKVVNGIITSPSNFECSKGGHCILLYGWNKDGWLIQNSWGKDWGNGGRAIYPYDYPTKEFWGVTDTDSGDIKKKEYNQVSNIIIKIINAIVNLFNKLTSKK